MVGVFCLWTHKTASLKNLTEKDTLSMTIKRLVWITNENGLVEAKTPFGVYELNEMPLGTVISFMPSTISCRCISDKRGVSLEQAKVIAQMDFETLVAECLT